MSLDFSDTIWTAGSEFDVNNTKHPASISGSGCWCYGVTICFLWVSYYKLRINTGQRSMFLTSLSHYLLVDAFSRIACCYKAAVISGRRVHCTQMSSIVPRSLSSRAPQVWLKEVWSRFGWYTNGLISQWPADTTAAECSCFCCRRSKVWQRQWQQPSVHLLQQLCIWQSISSKERSVCPGESSALLTTQWQSVMLCQDAADASKQRLKCATVTDSCTCSIWRPGVCFL